MQLSMCVLYTRNCCIATGDSGLPFALPACCRSATPAGDSRQALCPFPMRAQKNPPYA